FSLRARSCLLTAGCTAALATSLPAAEPAAPGAATNAVAAANTPVAAGTNAGPHFDVRDYVIRCDPLIFSNAPTAKLSQYTGTNLGLERIVQAAAALLLEYEQQGYPRANISIAQELITNGIVTIPVFQGAFPQVLISGRPCFRSGDVGAAALLAAVAPSATHAPAAVKTNAPPRFSVIAYEIRGDPLLSTNT